MNFRVKKIMLEIVGSRYLYVDRNSSRGVVD